MVKSLDFRFFPIAPNIRSFKKISFLRIITNKSHIKNSVVIPQTSSPHPFSVNALTILQPLTRSSIKFGRHIIYNFPIHKIKRLQNSTRWKKMHCGTNHVINISHTNYIYIRKIRKNDVSLCHKKNVPLPKYFYNDKETFICIQDSKGGESLPPGLNQAFFKSQFSPHPLLLGGKNNNSP